MKLSKKNGTDSIMKLSKKNDTQTYSPNITNNKIKTRINFSSIDNLNPMEIFNSYYTTPKYYQIDSIEDYIKCVLKLSSSYYELAFRGEPNIYSDTIASVFRTNSNSYIPDMLKKEYYREIGHSLMSLEQENFLSYSQHHGLPTELLDITKIPLYALYFACSENPESQIGIVHIYNIEQALDLSSLTTNYSFNNQIFDINKYIMNYYVHDTIEVDNFFEVFTNFLNRNSTCTNRLLGEVSIYLNDLEVYITDYYVHDTIEVDNFFEVFTNFLNRNSTCTNRLLGEVSIYLNDLEVYITDYVKEQLTDREIKILELLSTYKLKYAEFDRLLGEVSIYLNDLEVYITDYVKEQLTDREIKILELLSTYKLKYAEFDSLYSFGIEITNSILELDEISPSPSKKYKNYCNFSKFSFNKNLIQIYLELLGMAFKIFDLIIGAIEKDDPLQNAKEVDTFMKNFFLPPLPLIKYSPSVKFDRIKTQEGEFIYQIYKIYKAQLFMDGEEVKRSTRINLLVQKINSNTRLVITNKQKILKQLDYLGINRKLIFPDSDNIALYIKDKYM